MKSITSLAAQLPFGETRKTNCNFCSVIESVTALVTMKGVR